MTGSTIPLPDPLDELARTIVEHSLREERIAYVQRGRAYANLDPASLECRFHAAFWTWFRIRASDALDLFADLRAEFDLRGETVPRVIPSEVEAQLQAELQAVIDGSPDLQAATRDFITAAVGARQ